MASSLLWSITLPDLPVPSYVFGTMHVRDARAYGRIDAVYAALDRCRIFATEFDLNTIEADHDPTALYLDDDKTLKDYLSPRRYLRLRTILYRTFNFDLNRHLRLRPMIISNLLGERVLAEQFEESLDAHLWSRATARGLELTGLESYASQQALLKQLPVAMQLKSLLSIGRHPARFRRQTQRLADLYAAGRLDTLYQTTRRGAGGMRAALIFQRNRRMAARIDELARRAPLFAAVGAAHLPGGKGVLRLLKQRGWRVRPVATLPTAVE